MQGPIFGQHGLSLGGLHPTVLQPRTRLCLPSNPIPNLNVMRAIKAHGITAVPEGGRMEARMGKSAPSCPCLVSQSNDHPFPRRRMSRAVHLFICHQSGLAPERVLFSLLPLSCSSCLPENFFRIVQVLGFYSVGFYFFALCWIFVDRVEAGLALSYHLSEEQRPLC